MDIKRDPAILRRKKIRNGIIAGLGVAAVVAISVAVSRMETAAPSVPMGTLWCDTVRQDNMVREVRGAGTLIPEEIRWIQVTATGRVERIVLRPGAKVEPGTVVLELSNPDLRQQVLDAELSWKAAVAQLGNQEANLRTGLLQQEFGVQDARSALNLARSDLEANTELAKEGLVSQLTIKTKQAAVDAAANRLALAEKQLAAMRETQKSQLAPQEASVSAAKARFDQLARQLEELRVRSTMSGLLQEVRVDVGQQVGPGTNLVRVSDPTRLKAEVRIPETQTKDLAIGQPARVDTRNGVVKGRVTRIDPASQNGTVGVDVSLDEALPPGARPDQQVDGVIELQRLQSILLVQSPAFGSEHGTISLFRITPASGVPQGGSGCVPGQATRVRVKLGVRSVQHVQIVDGLTAGDRVVLSDMSQYDGFTRVRIN